MNKYRITKRGKLSIIVFSIIFLLVNISFIPAIKVKTWKDASAAENKVYKEKLLSNSDNKPGNIRLVNDIINVPEKKPLKQTTSQALSIESNKELSYPVEQVYKPDGKKIAFLTFDDGPSSTNTPKVLEILRQNDIKATFFAIGYEAYRNMDVLIKIKNEGHVIGNHTYSHSYGKIYSSVEKFITDIKKTDEVFKQVLGDDFRTRICRFPGGSFGENKKPFIQELVNNGYIDINWNTITGDAEGINIDSSRLIKKLKATAKHQNHLVVLMHDSSSKNTTVEALPEIIEYLKQQGYEFATLL